jgi:excisionase family DNA binding protein
MNSVVHVAPLTMPVNRAAAQLGLSRSSIYRLLRAGELSAVRVCGRTLIHFDSMKRLIDGGRRQEQHADMP